MLTKVYERPGLTFWQTVVYAGAAAFELTFQGGKSTNRGFFPATLTTSNEVLQEIIENSPQFRKGLIRLVSTSGTPTRRPKPSKPQASSPATKTPDNSEPTPTPEALSSDTSAARVTPDPAAPDLSPAEPACGLSEETSEPTPDVLTFPTVAAASLWLKNTHGVPSHKTRSLEKLMSEAETLGLKIAIEA